MQVDYRQPEPITRDIRITSQVYAAPHNYFSAGLEFIEDIPIILQCNITVAAQQSVAD
jgi:hypothetical protein